MVGHDDLHCYRSIQEGLAWSGSDWVSLHRNHSAAEAGGIAGTFGATNEAPMRGQYRAWAELMTFGMDAQATSVRQES
jgi:benzoate/toluate 1,2-dioxygenase subunit alpha